MALYSRKVAHQSRATDEVLALVCGYENGVSLKQLMHDNPKRLRDAGAVYCCIQLLLEEGKIRFK